MNDTSKTKTKKEVKSKMSGWLIALIVIAALFVAGAICCNTLGKAQGESKNPSSSTMDISKK